MEKKIVEIILSIENVYLTEEGKELVKKVVESEDVSTYSKVQ